MSEGRGVEGRDERRWDGRGGESDWSEVEGRLGKLVMFSAACYKSHAQLAIHARAG